MKAGGAIAGMALSALGSVVMAHDEGFAAGEPGDPTKPYRTIDMRMQEASGSMAFSPAKVEVELGEQVKFVLNNTGELDHEFMLDSPEHNAKHKIAMEKNPEMEHDDPNGKRLQPKASAEIVWKFTKPGTFEYACLIPGHYEAGMHGVIVVAGDATTKKKAGDHQGSSKESMHDHEH
jgi:uncharacterized cupredoxin-like copper-binding protein